MGSRRRWLDRRLQTAPSVKIRSLESMELARGLPGSMKKGRSVRDNLVLGDRQVSNHGLGIAGCQGCPGPWGERSL